MKRAASPCRCLDWVDFIYVNVSFSVVQILIRKIGFLKKKFRAQISKGFIEKYKPI